MKKSDWYILIPILLGAIWLSFLPNKRYKFHEISPKELLYQISQNKRYFSTDQIAKAIIGKNPSFILVDVRTPEEYAKFTLNGALNIPFDSLMNADFNSYLDQNTYKVVLFSNGSSLADQAWLLLHRMGYKGTYVMKGGLNKWIETIIRPEKPTDLTSEKDRERYQFRKTASLFFGGGSSIASDEKSSNSAPPMPVIKRKKTATNVGGCE